MKGKQCDQIGIFFNSLGNKFSLMGGSPGLVVMGRDSRSKGRGFESWRRMDIFPIYLLCVCNVCLKRPKINEKEAGVGPFF